MGSTPRSGQSSSWSMNIVTLGAAAIVEGKILPRAVSFWVQQLLLRG